MTTATATRSHFHGVVQIFRFNRRMYVAGAVTLIVASVVIALVHLPVWLTIAMAFGTVAAALWLILSLVVSYVVYDLSPLCRWEWIVELLDRPRHLANIHAGFDESSWTLRRLFPGTTTRVLDIFDPREMTEPSIVVARRFKPDAPSEPADFKHLPLADAACDAVTLLLAAHELRSTEARIAFLREVDRVLAPAGRVILAEHLRDLPNFLAFGPGFTHFHSRRTWLADAAAAGLRPVKQRRITPFVRIFVFERSNP